MPHTTRDTAAAILHSHRAHYLLSVKGNASETYAALDTIDWEQDATASFCEQSSKGHGRIDQRHIHTMKPNPGMLNYPQVKQVFRIIRHRHTLKTGVDSREVAYGITSLSPEQADAKRLLALNRGHWTIENGNHRYRDTTFAEDACLIATVRPNAILNNMALAVIFHRGSHVAAAVQEFAMDRSQAYGRSLNPADRSAQRRLIRTLRVPEPPASAPTTPVPGRCHTVTAGKPGRRTPTGITARSTSSQARRFCGTDGIVRLHHRATPFRRFRL